MKIIICASLSALQEILNTQKTLEQMGHQVETPEGAKHESLRPKAGDGDSEKADIKIVHDLIRGYYEKIKHCDAVLVVNADKKEIKNYIGGNTLLEMGFAHVLNKKLYCLNPLPELSYTSELAAMQPIILNGDLSKIE
jgi:nucleoside 2-deoxyribosyltransferase